MDIKHKKEIVAWTEGEQIQSRLDITDIWFNDITPTFDSDVFYRIKPKPQINPIHGEYYKVNCCDVIHVMRYDIRYGVFRATDNKKIELKHVTVLNKMVDSNE